MAVELKITIARILADLNLAVRYRIVICTVFIRIVAAATIYFSLARVRLLIKGGSYSRAAFIYFGEIPLGRSGGILL